MARWTVRGIVADMMPVLAVLTLIELVSGVVLDTFQATLLRFPSLLVLVPVTIGLAGNIGSIMASRLSTATHLGLLSFEPTDETLVGNALATVGIAVTLFPAVGAGAWVVQTLLAGTRLPLGTVVLVATLSGAALAALAVFVTVAATYTAFRVGADPDDVVLPVVTNTCDVLGVLVLFAVVRLLV
jgi:mgtE-like transporter